MEMKKCKECGKLFQAKSARTQYCNDLHYRPCPVCGKPVEAKYLSDPARCCSRECQKQLKSVKTDSPSLKVQKVPKETSTPSLKISDSSSVVRLSDRQVKKPWSDMVTYGTGSENQELEDIYDFEDMLREQFQCMTYLGKRRSSGFEPGHEYALQITKSKSTSFTVKAVYNFKRTRPCCACITLPTETAIYNMFTNERIRIREDGSLEVIDDDEYTGDIEAAL